MFTLSLHSTLVPTRRSSDLEFDTRDILYVRIDRRRKMPATILLKVFGYTTDDLLRMYYPVEEIHVQKGKMWRKLDQEIHAGLRDRKSTRLNSSHEWNSYAVF